MLKKNKSRDNQQSIAGGLVSHSLNSLVQGTTLEGDITSQSDIRIDGKIKGNLNCGAKLIIGPTGEVEGNVDCLNAVIEGNFEGVLHVKELLSIAETAKVSGEIRYSKLIVQPGAVLIGDVRLVSGQGDQPSSASNRDQDGKGSEKSNS